MQQAIGTRLRIGANSIAELKSIAGLELSADTIDTTTLDAVGGYRTYEQGLKDAGEVSVSGFFNPADTNGQAACYTAFANGTKMPFTILFPAAMGASWSFDGIVTGFSTTAEVEDGIGFEMTIKVSGAPTLGVTPSAGLTNLVVTGAGGALSPAFATGTTSYAFSGVTATSITVTATGAGQTIKLFVDGAFVQDLTSGSASAAISLPAIGTSKKLTIIANETGKTARMYEVIAVKTA